MRTGAITKALAVMALLVLSASLAQAAQTARPHWWASLQVQAQRDGYGLMRPADIQALYQKGAPMVVIDARTVSEFKAGHLPGARNVEFHMGHTSRLEPAKEKEFLSALGPDKERRVVIYDRGLQCVRGQLAAQWAVTLGYKNVWHLAEGWMGWAALTQTQGAGAGEVRPAGVGDAFPGRGFTLLDKEQDRAYLGLPPKATRFELGSLPARYAVVELYNELCFACCQSVPELNRLQGLIENDPSLAGRLKMMGVGVGNHNREVRRFRREQHIAFPLFSDQGRKLHKQLGEPVLPVIYLLRLHGQAAPAIVSIVPGPFNQADTLLQRLKHDISSDQNN